MHEPVSPGTALLAMSATARIAMALGVSALVVHRSGFHLGGVHGFAGMLKTVGSLIHRAHGGGAGDGEGDALAAADGARMFRVHEVGPTRRVLEMVASIAGDRPPTRTVRGLA